MAPFFRAWRWFFDVSNPHDPKLRGWLHPTCALAFNLSLALMVACAAFLAAPSAFQEAWMQHQPQTVVHIAQRAAFIDNSKGSGLYPFFQWLRRTIGQLLLPEKLLFDREQAFTLYSWEEGDFDPRSLGTFLAIYVALMLASRLYEKGPVMLYDAAWACNLALALTAVALWLNIPFLVSACSCWVAVDQLLWYVDCISYVVRGRFLVGVAKYIGNKDTPQSSSSETGEKAGSSKSGGRTEKGSMDVLNVNVSWRCWADVTHHLPFLGMFDDKPWYMFVVWNQLVWGLGNCFLFGIFLTVSNLFRR
ncbi:hypothetical protein, conserved [Eimeria praecox]|uniref:Uncharacterized protein n=1 Tax=Eimeria praecox TaxID=51316 RepID=U6H4Q7_9EIME|nr:hypothetical protein, conserved [Eimeria praecox]